MWREAIANDMAANDVPQAYPVHVIRRGGGLLGCRRLGTQAGHDGRSLLAGSTETKHVSKCWWS